MTLDRVPHLALGIESIEVRSLNGFPAAEAFGHANCKLVPCLGAVLVRNFAPFFLF